MIFETTYTTDPNGTVIHPDAMEFFGHTMKVGNLLIGEYSGSLNLTPYAGDWPPNQYRTQVTPTEFIGLFTGEEWAESVTSADPDVIKFVSQLTNRVKSFPTTHQRVTDGMTAIAQAADIAMTGARAQEIVKGVQA